MEVVKIIKVLAKTQQQQTAINKEYTVNIQAEEIEKAVREAEAAVRGRGNQKEKGKKT